MLGTLAKYIFGGLISEAPETSTPEMQYHTREVNDWLLVDMPDQAIDNEDMNSESDDDEILTALPLLMAEEMTLQIAQSCEELKDHSACDNSTGKVQKHLDVKIRSIPSGVQHNSGDKNQGNFNDKVEDNFPAQVLDISNSIKQDKSDIQVRDISIQTNPSDKIQTSDNTIPKNSNTMYNKNICVSNQLQCNLDKENNTNSTSKVEVSTAGENSIDKIQVNLQENIDNETIGKPCDISQFSSVEENTYCSENQILKSNARNTYSKEYITKILREVEMQLQERAHEQLYGKDQVLFRRPQLEFKNAGTTELHQDYVAEHAVLSDNIENTNDNIHDSSEKQKFLDNDIINKSVNKEAVNKAENYLINDMKENKVKNQSNNDKAQFSSVSELKKINVSIDKIKEDTGKDDKFIIKEQDSSNKQSNNENQLKDIRGNFTSGRRLYSQVVKGCKDNVQLNFSDADDQIINSFGNGVEAVFLENDFLTSIQDVLAEDQSNNIQIVFPGSDFIIYDQYVSKKEANENKTMQGILSNGQNKLYQEYKDEGLLHTNDRVQDNISFGRKLYSEVVQENKARVQENCNKTRNDLAVVKYKRFMPIFDYDVESSDDDMDENSNDEMHESSDAEIDENSDAEAEVKINFNDEVSGKLCDTIGQFPTEEENGYWSESELFKSYYYPDHSKQYYNEVLKELRRVERELQKKAHEKYANKTQTSKGVVPLYPQLFSASSGYNVFPLACSHEGSFQQVNSTNISQYNEMFQTHDDYMNVFNEDSQTEEKTSSPTPCLIANSAEIVQNLMNQMSTVLPKKTAATAYIKEQIKELKPMQQAIQFENRKYMTRSQFNRQNRNYLYQSSVKTNRRKNLQRNPSGANNNRRC